ncbi:hypothetical protein L0P24_23005, partial [Phocaeicola vulgatus]|nr:hypothetical protein [Phocaeicola vulgatus]MCB6281372.1 hypothetical protein [Phocaeicola vulgatus]MCB6293607.1 hypothetical protein [Phocaeicola vulgatus]MCB6327366.1 hypothetical protein [Phocaeicola vulgatus]MCB6451016.1 hypothetical protein [Phocaeicola vulgatus]
FYLLPEPLRLGEFLTNYYFKERHPGDTKEKILATKAACRPSLNLNTRLLIFLSNTDMSLHLVG